MRVRQTTSACCNVPASSMGRLVLDGMEVVKAASEAEAMVREEEGVTWDTRSRTAR